MLSPEALRYLRTDSGRALLDRAASLEGELLTRLTRLRKEYPAELAAAAVELLDLRRRGARKFERAADMFLTAQGLEQSSGEAIARWRAGRFAAGARVLDLCCGIGGDSVALGARGPVTAVDLDPAAVECVEANAAVYGVEGDVTARCADATAVPLDADAAFLDPSRRREGRRVKRGEEYAPPLSFIHAVRERIPNLGVKVSPALDDETLESFGARIEFLSDRGECKEAVLWFGDLGGSASRAATLLPANLTLAADPAAPRPPLSEPLGWLAEPDPAVIRAHLVPEIAAMLGAAQLDPMAAYLTADTRPESPYVTAYRVLEWMPFSLKRVQAHLKTRGWRVQAIKRRGVPLDPNELGPRLTGGGEKPVIVVLGRVGGIPAAVLCEPPVASG